MKSFTVPGSRFFEVDDIVVRFDSDGKRTKASVVSTGVPFPIAKALVEGRELSPEEAMRLAVASSAADGREVLPGEGNNYMKKLIDMFMELWQLIGAIVLLGLVICAPIVAMVLIGRYWPF